MVVHLCDRCKKETKNLETYVIPDFTGGYVGFTRSHYEIYGHPVRMIELCPDCKKELENLLNNFLKT